MGTRSENGSSCHINFCKFCDRTRNTGSGMLLPSMNLGSPWKYLRHLVGRSPEMTCLHNSDKISRRKSVSFRSFGLPAGSIADLLLRKESITIQHSSPILLFLICKQIILRNKTKEVEMLGNVSGESPRSQFKAFLRSS
jgi:hypothetical protein